MQAIFYNNHSIFWHSPNLNYPLLFKTNKHEYAEYFLKEYRLRHNHMVPSQLQSDTQANRAQLFMNVLIHLTVNHGYANPELSLNRLASKMKTNRSILSEVINTYATESFSVFLMRIRIEKFKLYAKDGTLSFLCNEGIAKKVGFTSKSSFYRSFKTIMGMSPAEYGRFY